MVPQANAALEAGGRTKLSNPRNAAAGVLRVLDDAREEVEKKLTFAAYQLLVRWCWWV